MVKINVYDSKGQIIDSRELSEQEPYNNPKCKHLHIVIDDDPMENVDAYKCLDCQIGWLVRKQDKIKE